MLNKKKIISLVVTSAFVFSTVGMMTACGKKSGSSRPVVAEDAVWYNSTKINLESPYDIDDVSSVMFNSPVYLDGNIYVLLVGERTFDMNAAMMDPNFDYNQYIINSVCKYDMDGNFVEEYNIENSSGMDVFQVNTMSVEDGNLKINSLAADANSESISNFYMIMNPENGEIIDSYDLEFGDGLATVENTLIVGDYTVFSLYGFSGDMPDYELIIAQGEDVINSVDVDEVLGENFWDIQGFVTLDDNTLAMSCFGEDGTKTAILDVSTGNLRISNESMETEDYYFTVTQDGKSFAVNDQGVYGIGQDLSVETVLDFSNSNVNAYSAGQAFVTYVDDSTVVLFGTEYSMSIVPDSYIYVLNKADSNPNAGKEILNVYNMNHDMSYSEAEAVVQFNNTNEKYFAVVSFSDDMGDNDEDNMYSMVNSASDQLMVDIMSGVGPDVVLNGAGIEQLNNPEYFVDLNTFINGDNGLDKSQYFSAIFDAACSNDGALYQIPVTFGMVGILARESDVGAGETGFTYDEYLEFVDTVCNGKNPIEQSQSDFLAECISMGMVQYNFDGTVNFDTEEFRNLAQFVNDNIHEPMDFGEDEYGMGMMFGGSSTFLSDGALSFEANSPLEYIYEAGSVGETVRMYGYPSSSALGPAAEIYHSAAISSVAPEEVQAAAWDFIKSMLAEDVQVCEDYSNPINRAAFETVVYQNLDMINEQYYLMVNMGMNEMMLNMYGMSLTDESVAQDYINFAESIETVRMLDTSVASIITEEMGAYFAGQKSIDQVIGTLNDRAQTVVNERAAG